MTESADKIKSLNEGETEKAGLTLNTQKTKIMASNSIISWQIEGEKVEAVTDFSWAPSLQMVTIIMKLKDVFSLEGKAWQT